MGSMDDIEGDLDDFRPGAVCSDDTPAFPHDMLVDHEMLRVKDEASAHALPIDSLELLPQGSSGTVPMRAHRRAPRLAHHRFKPAVRALIAAIALVAVAFGGAYAVGQAHRETERQDALAQLHPISFDVAASGLDSATGTEIPVRVVGTSAAGEEVDKLFFINESGNAGAFQNGDASAMRLPAGSYTFSVPASPIAVDGTVYSVSGAPFEGTVGENGLEATARIALAPIEAAKVTDEQINAAYAMADRGGASSKEMAYRLKGAAINRRDAAVKASEAAANAKR